MKLLAVRHGVTSFNTQQRWQGASDIPLADEGLEQAETAARRLASMGWRGRQVFCSTLARSRVTAETICEQLALDPPRVMPELGERELGTWEGRTVDEIESAYPGLIAAWTAGLIDGPPGGEADRTVAKRFQQACEAIDALCAEDANPVLIITHAGVLHAVDHMNGFRYSKYGPLSGRWFELMSSSRSIEARPDGMVDLLADEFDPQGPDHMATEVWRDR